MDSALIEIDGITLTKLEEVYADISSPSPTPYALFFAKGEGFVLTVYGEKNGVHRVFFQGPNAEKEAKLWGEIKKQEKKETPILVLPKGDQIGSDEVGTGDFFGPVIVVASYVPKAKKARLKELGVTDSKKMDDETILALGPTLIKEFSYSALTLSNEKYNEVRSQGLNMNAIKAKMHNRALLNLKNKFPEATCCIDQFAEEKLYYSYLKQEKEIAKPIVFSTKGESIFPSVALASVIARYSFLRKMEEMGKEYGLSFPLGAGKEVDIFIKKLLQEKGEEIFLKIGKLNFANWKKAHEEN